jgi:hypothetical protein
MAFHLGKQIEQNMAAGRLAGGLNYGVKWYDPFVPGSKRRGLDDNCLAGALSSCPPGVEG